MNRFRILVATLAVAVAATMRAQSDLLEYRWEIGGGPALVFPITDGVSFMQSVNLGGGLVARRNFNPRMGLRMNLSLLHASGNTRSTFIPVDPGSGTPEGGVYASRSWSRNMLEMGCVGELNFWGYGEGPRYKGNKRLTPYILLGVGVMMALGGEKTDVALALPIGLGVKYKVAKRLNLGFEWRFTFTTTDRLEEDGGKPSLADPYGVKSEGLKNKDQYSTMMVTLTYDISPKYRKCNN
ncbi:MAG: outer membrane beta-barrel protein [Bacteroidaceae bacterium]|nr:outer membrane beta-barrel protein [Bacteroidaceae bacterium]